LILISRLLGPWQAAPVELGILKVVEIVQKEKGRFDSVFANFVGAP
jgi:hypothetical protein